MKISKIYSGVAVILMAALVAACPGVGAKPSAEVSQYENEFVSVTPVKVVGKAIGVDNPSYSNKDGDLWAGEFVDGRIVTISPFTIATTELTYGLWKDVQEWGQQNNYLISPGKSGTHGASIEENHPVVNVDWNDAIVWCNAYTEMKAAKAKDAIKLAREKGFAISEDIMQASKMKPVYYDAKGGKVLKDKNKVFDNMYMDKTAKGFRLPTSVEWEYAARYQGDDPTNAVKLGEAYFTKLNSASGTQASYINAAVVNKVAWYKGNSGLKTHPVAEKNANYLGLYDMSGNVWEWIYDGVAVPKAGEETDPVAPFVSEKRLIRGGSRDNELLHLVVGFRDPYFSVSASFLSGGLRLVRSL